MSLARLHRLADIVDRTDPQLTAWLRAGVSRWQSGEELEKALELCGGRARGLRDKALRRAAMLIDPNGKLGPHARSAQVMREVSHFIDRVQGKKPSSQYTPVQQAISDAIEAGTLPKTVRQIYNIIGP